MATAKGRTRSHVALKRTFDLVVAGIGLLATSWLILLAWLASVDTWSNGFFTQRRVGKGGRIFTLVKIKTMRPVKGVNTTVTRLSDPRITPLGRETFAPPAEYCHFRKR